MNGPVELHIGSLALEGFSPLEAARVEDSFRRELARLTADELRTTGPREVMRHTLAPGDRSPEAIGAAAARKLAEGLRQ